MYFSEVPGSGPESQEVEPEEKSFEELKEELGVDEEMMDLFIDEINDLLEARNIDADFDEVDVETLAIKILGDAMQMPDTVVQAMEVFKKSPMEEADIKTLAEAIDASLDVTPFWLHAEKKEIEAQRNAQATPEAVDESTLSEEDKEYPDYMEMVKLKNTQRLLKEWYDLLNFSTLEELSDERVDEILDYVKDHKKNLNELEWTPYWPIGLGIEISNLIKHWEEMTMYLMEERLARRAAKRGKEAKEKKEKEGKKSKKKKKKTEEEKALDPAQRRRRERYISDLASMMIRKSGYVDGKLRKAAARHETRWQRFKNRQEGYDDRVKGASRRKITRAVGYAERQGAVADAYEEELAARREFQRLKNRLAERSRDVRTETGEIVRDTRQVEKQKTKEFKAETKRLEKELRKAYNAMTKAQKKLARARRLEEKEKKKREKAAERSDKRVGKMHEKYKKVAAKTLAASKAESASSEEAKVVASAPERPAAVGRSDYIDRDKYRPVDPEVQAALENYQKWENIMPPEELELMQRTQDILYETQINPAFLVYARDFNAEISPIFDFANERRNDLRYRVVGHGVVEVTMSEGVDPNSKFLIRLEAGNVVRMRSDDGKIDRDLEPKNPNAKQPWLSPEEYNDRINAYNEYLKDHQQEGDRPLRDEIFEVNNKIFIGRLASLVRGRNLPGESGHPYYKKIMDLEAAVAKGDKDPYILENSVDQKGVYVIKRRARDRTPLAVVSLDGYFMDKNPDKDGEPWIKSSIYAGSDLQQNYLDTNPKAAKLYTDGGNAPSSATSKPSTKPSEGPEAADKAHVERLSLITAAVDSALVDKLIAAHKILGRGTVVRNPDLSTRPFQDSDAENWTEENKGKLIPWMKGQLAKSDKITHEQSEELAAVFGIDTGKKTPEKQSDLPENIHPEDQEIVDFVTNAPKQRSITEWIDETMRIMALSRVTETDIREIAEDRDVLPETVHDYQTMSKADLLPLIKDHLTEMGGTDDPKETFVPVLTKIRHHLTEDVQRRINAGSKIKTR